MTKLKLGDRISVKLNGTSIVSPYSEYTDVRTFDIIGIDGSHYYLYVPPYIIVSDTVKLDRYNCKKFGILPKFMGEEAILIYENKVYQVISKLDGCFCGYCGEFCDLAAPNQMDGGFICWYCRQNPYRITIDSET